VHSSLFHFLEYASNMPCLFEAIFLAIPNSDVVFGWLQGLRVAVPCTGSRADMTLNFNGPIVSVASK
jgi:hypothetical protein